MIKMANNPRIMYKFGQTSCDDVAERFTREYALKHNFDPEKVLLCEDFKIDILWSAFVTREQADEAETAFEKKYPKNVITYKKYNGITECRAFSYDESVAITSYLRKKFPPQSKKPGMVKLYWVMAKKLEQLQPTLF